MKYSVALVSLGVLVGSHLSVHAQVSYKVDDAYAQMRNEIRKYIEPAPAPGNWFSLTAIGAVAEKDDPAAINELANFCPDPSGEISRFGGIRPLDLVYEAAITSMVAQVFAETPALKEARRFLRGTSGSGISAEYAAYKTYNTMASGFSQRYLNAVDEKTLNSIYIESNAMEKDWKILGFKNEVEAALFQIDQSEGVFGATHNFHRQEVLNAYRFHGDTKKWIQGGAFLSPASDVSPPVATWENSNGWFKITFNSKTFNNSSGSTSSASSSFGFLHLGGLLGGGSRGGGGNSNWSVKDVKEYGYSFEIKRVAVIRGWLDSRVFNTVGGWTWRKNENTDNFPLISAGYTSNNEPIVPKFVVYNGLPVDCPMIPSEMLIARNRSITLTTSREDYQQVSDAGSSGGGGILGGIFGGGTRSSWSTTKITDNGNDVTYKVDAPGTAVIGLVSQLVGGLPAPDPKKNWPAEAWVEKTP